MGGRMKSSVISGTVWPISVLICTEFSKQHEKKLLTQLNNNMVIHKHPLLSNFSLSETNICLILYSVLQELIILLLVHYQLTQKSKHSLKSDESIVFYIFVKGILKPNKNAKKCTTKWE